jgi:hypothetical protein
MPDNVGYTIQVPIRQVDAEDVKNAFAKMFSYQERVDLGLGVLEPNPITKEVFVEKCCAQFLFNIYKNHMIQKAESDAKVIAESESNQRSQDVVAWFDNLRSEALPANTYSNHPIVEDVSISTNSNQNIDIILTGTDPDNLPLSFEIYIQPNVGSASISEETLTYIPDANYNGTLGIVYRAFNGTKYSNPANIIIDVNCVKPSSVNISTIATKNTPVDIILLGTDPLNGSLSYSLGSATSGTISILNNVVTYTPDVDFTGEASFGFSVNNGFMDSDEFYVYITVGE